MTCGRLAELSRVRSAEVEAVRSGRLVLEKFAEIVIDRGGLRGDEVRSDVLVLLEVLALASPLARSKAGERGLIQTGGGGECGRRHDFFILCFEHLNESGTTTTIYSTAGRDCGSILIGWRSRFLVATSQNGDFRPLHSHLKPNYASLFESGQKHITLVYALKHMDSTQRLTASSGMCGTRQHLEASISGVSSCINSRSQPCGIANASIQSGVSLSRCQPMQCKSLQSI